MTAEVFRWRDPNKVTNKMMEERWSKLLVNWSKLKTEADVYHLPGYLQDLKIQNVRNLLNQDFTAVEKAFLSNRHNLSTIVRADQLKAPDESIIKSILYLRDQKGYRFSWKDKVPEQNLSSNSVVVRSNETGDFGAFEFISILLACVIRAGGSTSQHSSVRVNCWKQQYKPCGNKAIDKFVEFNKAISGTKAKAKSQDSFLNNAICGIKTTSALDAQATLISWLLHVNLLQEILKNDIKAFTRLISFAVTVRFLAILAISDLCEKIQSEGDDFKKKVSEIVKERSDIKATELSSSSENSTPEFTSMAAMGEFENFGFGQDEGMEGQDPEDAQVPARNDGGVREEDFLEIPDFAEFGDEEEDEEEYARRMNANNRELRRVPSLPGLDDLMYADEEYALAGDVDQLGERYGAPAPGRSSPVSNLAEEWVNELHVDHNDVAQFFLQLNGEARIPPEPEIPEPLPLWMEDPWAFDQMVIEVDTANAG